MKKSKTTLAQILSFESNETELRAQLSSKSMDWEWFVKASSQLGVMTSAYCRLEQKGLLDLIPEDLSSYLSEITTINRNRNETLLEQVKELSTLFNSDGINHVFIKGCALMASGYFKDFGERLIGDIDVLVEPSDLNKAGQLLLDLKYVASKASLFGQYKDHRHLPRLVHKDRLGAVEVHSKILRKNIPKTLNPEKVLKNRILVNQVYVPKVETSIDILILNDQVNDFGYLLKLINFKSCYDSLVIEHQINQPKDNSKISKYHHVYYNLGGHYFKTLRANSTKKNTVVANYLYKHINQNGIVRLMYTWLAKVYIGLLTLMEGVTLFLKNKRFRAAVWNHKSEVLKTLKGENKYI